MSKVNRVAIISVCFSTKGSFQVAIAFSLHLEITFLEEMSFHFHLLVRVKSQEAILARVRNDISTGDCSVNELAKVVARNVISEPGEYIFTGFHFPGNFFWSKRKNY